MDGKKGKGILAAGGALVLALVSMPAVKRVLEVGPGDGPA